MAKNNIVSNTFHIILWLSYCGHPRCWKLTLRKPKVRVLEAHIAETQGAGAQGVETHWGGNPMVRYYYSN